MSIATGRGKLYICATPIGNLEDITLRALRILKEVDLIIAEDTRRSRFLLKHYNITTPFDWSYYQGVEEQRAEAIIKKLKEGQNIALICDAGTPLISDPGYPLVRKAIEEGIPVIPIPGPTALITGLVASGIPVNNFIFDGTPPKKEKSKREYFQKIKTEERTVVLYESPHRIGLTLKLMAELLGQREIALCRELTKVHEEILRGTPAQILKILTERGQVKGEITLVIKGASAEELKAEKQEQKEYQQLTIEEQVKDLIAEGLDKMEAIKRVAQLRGLSKREIYNKLLKLGKERKEV